jgi:hypothetical protein
MISYKSINDDIKTVWLDIKESKYKYKKEVYNKLIQINEDINTLNKDKDILFDLSQSVLRLYELMSTAIFEDLSSLSMILNYGIKDEVYFIFNKEAVKIWATKLDWFFSLYNKAEIIYENNEYILLRDTLSSNLCFTANIVLDKDKNILLEKYVGEPTAITFYEEIKSEVKS